jgi:hypothetical protein
MAGDPNALQWDGKPGHYEVYYLSATDRGSGCGLWIRYTMVAPLHGEATCSLWFMAMDPNEGGLVGRKHTRPADDLKATSDPFELRIGDSALTDRGMAGGFEDVSWDVRWQPGVPAAEPVHPVLRRAKVAKTILLLPHPAFEVDGTVAFDGRTLELDGARGGQAHLWGSKHASSWAWAHCNDLEGLDGSPRPGAFVDGVSVNVPRLGREVGPSTPIVARVSGHDFTATSPVRVVRAGSRFALTTWRFDARDGDRRLVGEVDAHRDQLAGVTYHDPDGDLAYCYNGETATMRLQLFEREGCRRPWALRDTLVAPGRALFEYAQREPVPGLPLLTR